VTGAGLDLSEMKLSRGFEKADVESPQAAGAQTRRGEQVGINPGDAHSVQPMLVQEAENFVVIGSDRRRQPFKVTQDVGPGSQIAAGDLAEDERVHQDLAIQ
jgi:hypothetical protein